MIYAKVDVKLRDHTRAHRAGAAMSTWTWALLYSREQETDGYIQDDMIRLAWVGETEARKHAKKLVEVGLWERDEQGPDGGGWRICRYSEKNETRAAIAERRAEAAERMQRVRANKQRTARARSHEQSSAVPGSGFGSGSGSDLESRSEDPPRSPREVPPAPESWPHNDVPVGTAPCVPPSSVVPIADPTAPPPAWWPGVLDTVEAQVGVRLASGECWLAYAGHRHGKARAADRNDALQWLVQVMVPKAKREAAEVRQRRERDAKFDAARDAKLGAPPQPMKPTREQAEADAKRFAAEVARRRGAA